MIKPKKRKKKNDYKKWLFNLAEGQYSLTTLAVHAKTSTSSVVRTLRNLGLQAEYIRNESTGYIEAIYTWFGKKEYLKDSVLPHL